jgi:hypothetical protein
LSKKAISKRSLLPSLFDAAEEANRRRKKQIRKEIKKLERERKLLEDANKNSKS